MYGIGLMLDQARLGSPVIISEITPHGPCAKAGKIRVNDRLAMVDGIPASSLAGEELSSLIFGLEGTKIRLTIEREDAGYPQRFDITVTRGPADANGTMENGKVGDGVHKDSKDSGEHKRGILHSLVAMLKILQSLDLPLESDRPPMTDDTARTREGKLVNFVFQEVKMLKQHQFVAHQLIQTVRDSVYAQQDIAGDVAVKDALKAYDKQTELLSLGAFKSHKGGPNIYSSYGSKFSETSLGASEQAAEEIDAALAASEHDSLRLQNTILKMDIVRKDRELTALKQKQGGGHGNLPREKAQQNGGENTNSIQHVTDTYTNVSRTRPDGKSLSSILPSADLGGSSIKYGQPADGGGSSAKGTGDKDAASRTGVQTILPLKAVDAQPMAMPAPLPGDPIQWSPKVQKSVSRFNESVPGSAAKEAHERATRDLHVEIGSQRASQLSDYQRASQDKLSAPPSPFFGTALDPLANNHERMERRWPPPNSNALVPPPSTPILGDVQSLSLSLAIPERKFNNLFNNSDTSPPNVLAQESQPGRLEHLLERSKRLTSEASDMLSGRPTHASSSTLASKTSPLTRQAVEELLEGDRVHQPMGGGSAEASSADPVLERIRRWQKDVPAPTNFNFQDAPPVSAAKPPAAPLSVRPPTTPSNHGDGVPWDPKPPESPLSMTNSEKKMRSVDEIKARRAAHNQAQDNLLKELAAALPTDTNLKPPRDPSIRQPSSTPAKAFGSDSALDPGRVPLSSDLLPPKPASSPSRFGVHGVPLSNSFSAVGSSPVLGPANPAGYPGGSLDEGRLASIDRGLPNLRSSDSAPSTAYMRQSDNPELTRAAPLPQASSLLRASDSDAGSMLGRNSQSAFTAYSNRRPPDVLNGSDALASSSSKRNEEMVPPWAREPALPTHSQPTHPQPQQQQQQSGMRSASPSFGPAAQPAPPSSLQWQEVSNNERAARDYYTPPAPPTNNWQDVPNQRRDFQPERRDFQPQPSYHRTPPPPAQQSQPQGNFQHGAPPPPNHHHAAPPPPNHSQAPPPPPPNRHHSPGPALNHAAPPGTHAHSFTPSHSPVVHPQRHPSPSHFSMAPPPVQVAPPQPQYALSSVSPAQHHPRFAQPVQQHPPPPPRPHHAVPHYGGANGDFQLLSVRTVQSNMNFKPGPRVWGDTACWA